MNLWKRATFYTLRKWKKSLLLFSIIFSVSTLILSGLAISDAQAEQTAELKETTGVSFTISRNSATGDWSTGTNGSYSTQAFISDDMIEKIASVNGIKNYNATYESCGLYQKSNGSRLEQMNPTGWSDVDSQLYEIGCINSAYNSLFLSNAFSLTDGRHISKEDKNGVLLNKEYAEKNGLRIGVKIKNANLSGEQNVIVEYEIIGLFDIQADKTDEKNNYNAASYYDYSQYAFLSMPAYKEATIHYPDGPSAGYTDADFFV